MKFTLPLFALVMLIAGGCAGKKDPATADLAAPSVTPMMAAPASYAPVAQPMPIQTAVPDQAPMPASSTINAGISSGGSYTIKPGDTLWKISASHYGDGKKWKQIVDANPGLSPSKLRVGQTITLP